MVAVSICKAVVCTLEASLVILSTFAACSTQPHAAELARVVSMCKDADSALAQHITMPHFNGCFGCEGQWFEPHIQWSLYKSEHSCAQ